MKPSVVFLMMGLTISSALFIPVHRHHLAKDPKLPSCFWIVVYKTVPVPVTYVPPPVVMPTQPPMTTTPVGIDERNTSTPPPETTEAAAEEVTEAAAEEMTEAPAEEK